MRLSVAKIRRRTHSTIRDAGICLCLIGIFNLPQGSLQAEELPPRHVLQGHGDHVCSVAFSPDGKTLASGSWDNTVKLWDVAAGKERITLEGHTGLVFSVAFSPDGKLLASGSWDKTVKLWDVTTGKEQATLEGHTGLVRSVAFSPDGKTLASASHDRTVKLWDVASGQEQNTLRGHTHFVECLAYSPDGFTLVSAGRDRTIRLWDLAMGTQRAVLRGHDGPILAVAFSPDGRTIASSSADESVKLWEVATAEERDYLPRSEMVGSMSFSPDGKTLATANKSIKLWNLCTDKVRVAFPEQPDEVVSVALSPDGKTLATGSDDKTVKLWDVPADPGVPRRAVLSPAELEDLWGKLAGAHALQSYQAILKLVAAPDQAVALLKERVRPILDQKGKDISSWITDLDSDDYVVREKATAALEKVGRRAEAALRQQIMGRPPLEVQRRIEKLLGQLEPEDVRSSIRGYRAVEVLEHIGTVEARKVLETLAAGAEGARLTEDAKSSLARLNRRVVAEK